MKLNVQIYTLIFSYLFGVIFCILLDLFNRIVKKYKWILRLIFSLLLILILSSVYFIVLLLINNGYLHVYFLFMIMFGYLSLYFFKKIGLHKNR